MKFSTAAVLLTSALGVSAHPSGHGHKHAHRSLEAREFVMYNKPPPPPAPEPTTTSAPPPPPKPTSTKAPEPEPTTEAPKPKPSPEDDSSSGSDDAVGIFQKANELKDAGLGVSTYTEFCGGKKAKRATLDQIMYVGNIGTDDDYGCNMMLVGSNVADEYKYVARIENVDEDDYDCVAYLKVGPDGGINGFFDGNEALRFTLPGGTVQHLAADANTQGGVICDKGKIPLTKWGGFASTWAEFDFGNESNDGWSGGDASCLIATAQGMPVPGLNMCGHDECSTIFPGGDGINAFLAGMEEEDGFGLNIPAGKARITITYGFTG